MIKRFSALVAAVAATMLASPALAAPSMDDLATYRDVSDHVVLTDALERVGVKVFYNHPQLCIRGGHGAYYSFKRSLVICQLGLQKNEIAGLTYEDLDTIRHEAHHVVQDCKANGLGDGTLGAWFGTPEEVVDFAYRAGLTQNEMLHIIQEYKEHHGASDIELVLEIEAFAVARAVDPATLAQAVTFACSNK